MVASVDGQANRQGGSCQKNSANLSVGDNSFNGLLACNINPQSLAANLGSCNGDQACFDNEIALQADNYSSNLAGTNADATVHERAHAKVPLETVQGTPFFGPTRVLPKVNVVTGM